jgi:uncharacterized membrane protein
MRVIFHKLADFRRNRGGAVAIIAAVSLMVLVAFTAAAVDFGSIYLKTRQLQGMADMAAISAATNLGQAQAAAVATVKANNWSAPVTVAAETGTYTPDPNIPPANRFRTEGGGTAARVSLSSTADLYFASVLLGRSNIPISRTAIASQAQLASFSLGTRLAALQGGMANAMLTALTGSSVKLSIIDYNSLANAQVDLFQYVSALKTRAGLTAASFNDTLQTNVKTSDALGAIVDVLTGQGNRGAGSAMATLAGAANSTKISAGQLVNLGPYGGQDYINLGGGSGAMVSALDLASAVLQLSQGGRQVQFSLNLGVPGITNATAWLAIGERPANSPWIAITADNSIIVRTAQARLYIDLKVSPASPIAGVASLDVPVIVELASAQAKLSSISCGGANGSDSVTVSVAPSIGDVALGQVNVANLNDFQDTLPITQANLISILLLQVTASSSVNIGGNDWQNVSFTDGDISSGTEKTVQTRDIAATTFSSLLGNLTVNVKILGLGLGIDQSAVKTIVQNTLSGVATPIDSSINGLTSLMGVGLGEADVRVNGVRCNMAALVQ